MPLEFFHAFNDSIYVIGAVRTIYLVNILGVYRVELQDVVIDTHQRIVYLLTMDERGV